MLKRDRYVIVSKDCAPRINLTARIVIQLKIIKNTHAVLRDRRVRTADDSLYYDDGGGSEQLPQSHHPRLRDEAPRGL